MPLVGFEPTISGSERPTTYALNRRAIGTGRHITFVCLFVFLALQPIVVVFLQPGSGL